MSGEPSRELLAFDPAWPPAVVIRRRSRRISLRLDSTGGLRVNAPAYVSQREIRDFITRNQAWLARQRSRSARAFEELGGNELGEFIKIRHQTSPNVAVSARLGQLNLKHPADFNDWAGIYEQGRGTIKRLINSQAKLYLLPEAKNTSAGFDRQPTAIRLRYMRSRWGSCHPKGIITLNSQLVRLPRELRRYVMYHELAHLEHPHHQPAFWSALTASIGPAKQLRQELRSYALWY